MIRQLAASILALIAFAASAQPSPAASAASAPVVVATPDQPCGAGGTGYGPGGLLVTRAAGEAQDMRIDAFGVWQACQPCPPARIEAFRAWRAGAHVCTSASADSSSTSADRDRVLPHGGGGVWRQWQGPMRGHLIESCSDGRRTVVSAICSPAVECDNQWEQRDGTRVYTYDARHESKRVPLGAYAFATAADGSRLRLQCVDGAFQRSAEPRTVAPVKPTEPKAVTCGAQYATGLTHGRHQRVFYGGRAVPVGATVQAQGAQLICGPDGKLTQDRSVLPGTDPANPWSAVGK